MLKKFLSTIISCLVLCAAVVPVNAEENSSVCDGGCPLSSEIDF